MPEPSGPPAGLVAIGHSQLTGENSDPALPGQPVPANSWATGTNPAVRSIYQRMLQKWPDTQGKVANAAVGGATAAQLEDQAVLALQQVPNPRLVIIQTIDNDILCDGNDLAAAKMFGVTLDGALKRITSLAPQSRILLVSQPGRPVTDAKAVLKAAQTDPSWASSLVGGTGPCDVFTPQGRLREAGVRYLTSVITAFEAGQARVCARYARCSTDDGAVRRLVNTPKGVSSDHNHANVTGLAALAAAEWPSVLAALGD